MTGKLTALTFPPFLWIAGLLKNDKFAKTSDSDHTWLIPDERTHEYGEPIGDPRYYPMGPFFIRQPNNTVFNQARRKIINDVSIRCIAQGWPTPVYSWFKEDYNNDTQV